MALIVNDRVKETSTTTGTGTLNLAGAEQGYETFVSGIGTTNTTYYAIENNSAGEFEVGIGTVTDASPDTLSRDTVISSSNSDSKVDFADLTFSSVTLSAVGALIYKSGGTNPAVLVLDFGGTKTATNGDFVVQFPTANSSSAIIRLGDA